MELWKKRPTNLVYFDLETQKSAEDVGGWGNKHLMRVSIGVTYSSEKDRFKVYEEDDMPALITELAEADLVLGYNIISFDYAVLSYYSDFDFSKLETLDLLTDLKKEVKMRLKLDNLTQATLGGGKSADGLAALEWFKSGDFAKIAIYCKEDVRITRDLHRYGIEHQHVFYTDRNNNIQKIPVLW